MKSQELVQAFLGYLGEKTRLEDLVQTKSEVFALYGDDEFKLDRERGRIWLPSLKWVDVGSLDQLPEDAPDFVLLYRDQDDEFSLQVGWGNPYKDASGDMPTDEQGLIMAVPNAFSSHMENIFCK